MAKRHSVETIKGIENGSDGFNADEGETVTREANTSRPETIPTIVPKLTINARVRSDHVFIHNSEPCRFCFADGVVLGRGLDLLRCLVLLFGIDRYYLPRNAELCILLNFSFLIPNFYT